MQNELLDDLQESEARFRAIFDNSAIGIVLADLDGMPRMVNSAIIRITGYSEQELLRISGSELGYPEDRELSSVPMMELLDGKRETFRSESRFVRKDGQVIWVRQTISAVRGSDGKPLYLVIMVEDIDEQKRNLVSLRESEERFRSMFENFAVGIGVMSLDHKLIDANPAFCRIYERSRKELIGMGAEEVTYPDDNPESAKLFREILMGQRDSYEQDRRYIRKNGEVFWAHITMSSVRGEDGTPMYVVGMVMDIDEQKHAAEELYKSQARFEAMFDNISIGMALVGFDGSILSVNHTFEQISGYTAEELGRINILDLVFPEDSEIGAEHFREMVAGQRDNMQSERRYVCKNGEIFWAQICYSLVRDPNGKPQYLVESMEDITDRKLSAEKLAEQEAEYRRVLEQRVEERTHELAEANHRLHKEIEHRIKIEEELASKAAEEAVTADRTRLARDLHDAVTQTLFSASLTAEVLPEMWEIDVEEAKKSTEELRQLTRGALAEMRTLLLELRPAALTQTSLGDLIRQLCEAFIGRSRLPITLAIEGERELPPEVQIACYRIAQECLNNVFKYAHATQVNVGLFLSLAGLRFEVCDNGIGFDMSMSKPTSLGMRIMRERTEAIGAELYISSTPGSGTSVELTWNDNPNVKLRVL